MPTSNGLFRRRSTTTPLKLAKQEELNMRKERADSISSNGNTAAPRVARTTVFLTDLLNENLDALALSTGLAKGELVRRALTQYITQEGLNPHKKPKIKVSY